MSLSARPRNVFILANNLEAIGGLQRVAHTLAQILAKRGHHVVLIGIHRHKDGATYVTDPAYRTVVLDAPREGKVAARAHRWWHRGRPSTAETARGRAVARLDELFSSVSEGIVICSQIHAMSYVAHAHTRHLRVIGQSHEQYDASRGWTPSTHGTSHRYDGINELYRHIDLFQVLTAEDARRFERDGFNNMAVMHNPLSFLPEKAAPRTDKRVVTIGRYDAQKDQRLLIDAFALVAESCPGWTLELWGDGPLRADLEAQVTALGLTDAVRVMGPTDDAESVLLSASVFALSSDFEGLPVVLCEAMACGVPCVSVDCGPGIRAIIDDGADGIVVPRGDAAALAAGIERLITDEEMRHRLGDAARRSIRRYAPEAIGAEWESVFDTVER